MTHRAEDGTVWVMEEPPGKCEDCGKVAETRPYGPGGIQVCFQCMMKDEEEAKRQFDALLTPPRASSSEGQE